MPPPPSASSNSVSNDLIESLSPLSLTTQRPMAKLVIEEPRLSDEALYKCDVTYVRGKCPSISLVRVQMMSLPEKAQIMQMVPSQQQQPTVLTDGQLIGPLNENDQLQLKCLVAGGRPAPQAVVWRRIDSAGRLINLKSSNNNNHHQQHSAGFVQRSTAAQTAATSQSQLIEVQLNHTLSSADLGAKFECHVEHEALETSSRLARVVSTSSSSSPAMTSSLNHPANVRLQQSSALDAMLDLHPAAAARQSSSGQDEDEPPIGQHRDRNRPAASSLDSHVVIDLNVGVSSLDLFLTKLHNTAAAASVGQLLNNDQQQQQVRKRNASEPLNEGDLIELECVAYNSKPAANITWLNGSELISQDLDSNGASSTTIMPPPLFQHNLWSSQSTATGRQQTRAATANSRQKRLLQRNQLEANSDGQTFNTHSFLSIKLSRHEHRSQITCQAQNEPMQKPLARTIELQVQHAPIVLMEPAAGIVTKEFDGMAAQQQQRDENNVIQQQQQQRNDDYPTTAATMMMNSASSSFPQSGNSEQVVNIYCIYTGNPHQLSPNSTRWFKDNKLISFEEESIKQHFAESTTTTGYPMLTIREPRRHHSGQYDCQVANSIGWSERLPASESCHLEVEFKPSVRLRMFRLLNEDQSLAELEKRTATRSFSSGELLEIADPEQEVILPNALIVFQCDIQEAKPTRINKFHWFSRQQQQQQMATTATTDGAQNQLKLGPLETNFTSTSFACSASNSIGQSEHSNRIDLQLSQAPGPSIVRPVTDFMLRKIILASGRPAHLPPAAAHTDDHAANSGGNSIAQPAQAGTELLLECLTQDLGQPKANNWLWFKNGQTIELLSSNSGKLQPSNDTAADQLASQDDNPISGQQQNQRAARAEESLESRFGVGQQQQQLANSGESIIRRGSNSYIEHNNNNNSGRGQTKPATKLLASGRYLYISSIQLAHKGNYSCVAVNRLGSGPGGGGAGLQQPRKDSPNQSINGRQQQRDSYELNVALAPSFVQPLASKTYWSESQMDRTGLNGGDNENTSAANPSAEHPNRLELVCHVQCEPICQIDWLRNNEPLELGGSSIDGSTTTKNYVTHQVQQTILDENEESNMFRSVESKLVLQFNHPTATNLPAKTAQHQQPSLSSSATPFMSRERTLERRQLLNGSNYTCQSSANSMGPPVRSTTQFVIQYPPENVFINLPSDKLSLVEGSNGPRLSCEASGEPQVQFRWLLVPSGNGGGNPRASGGDLVAAATTTRYNLKHFTAKQMRRRQQQQSNGTQQSGGTNDPDDDDDFDFRPIELSAPASGEQVGGAAPMGGVNQQQQQTTSVSTLDLSSTSLDRKQAGHYVCEASNKLGRTRQSVYVNVLYKPTGIAVHLHSLDMILEAPIKIGLAEFSSSNGNNFIQVKPSQATDQDEYSIVHETSEDFISLRRTLLMSPILNSPARQRGNEDDDHNEDYQVDSHMTNANNPFRDSIFQTILSEQQQQSGASNKNALIRDKNELITSSATAASSEQTNNELPTSLNSNNNSSSAAAAADLLRTIQNGGGSGGTPWTKFNELLLKFLNNYVKQTKLVEEQRSASDLMKRLNTRLSRQSTTVKRNNNNNNKSINTEQQQQQSILNNNNNYIEADESLASQSSQQQQHIEYFGVRNLITFACLAKDGNPLNNLTFNWSFGSMNLNAENLAKYLVPQTGGALNEQQQFDSLKQKPLLLYLNRNSTLAVKLIRRLDTKSALNPFQLSLITLNVIVLNGNHDQSSSFKQQNQDNNQDNNNRPARRQAATQPPDNNLMRAPKYQPLNQDHLRANDAADHQPSLSSLASTSSIPAAIELSEQNWQEQLGQQLKCSIENQIGTSEPVQVRINLAERKLRQQSMLNQSGGMSSSFYEFAKWRHLPSFAQKSLLILSILIGFLLIVFATIALLLGVNLKQVRFITSRTASSNFAVVNSQSRARTKQLQQQQQQNNDGSNSSSDQSKDDCATTNTGQSTCSQKSSVLGLLNNGESLNSFHGSSDDDTGPQQQMSHLQQQQQFVALKGGRNAPLGNQHHHHPADDLSAPPSLLQQQQQPPPVLNYKPTLLMNDVAGFVVGQQQQQTMMHGSNNNNDPSAFSGGANRLSQAGNRLLASLKLKSLARMKVDRISDSMLRADLHAKNVSNSETITTGLSSSINNDSHSDASVATATNNQPTMRSSIDCWPVQQSKSNLFGHTNLRHSHHQFNHQQQQQLGRGNPATIARHQQHPNANYSAFSNEYFNENYQNPLTLNTQALVDSATLYSNVPFSYSQQPQQPQPNAMDEFMRSRGLDLDDDSIDNNTHHRHHQQQQQTLAAYRRAQSSLLMGHPGNQQMYSLRNTTRDSDMQNRMSFNNQTNQRPLPKAKPPVYPRQHNTSNYLFETTRTDDGPLSAYNSSSFTATDMNMNINHHHQPPPRLPVDTIDSHLNRLSIDGVALIGGGAYQQQQQLEAYANAMELQRASVRNQHQQLLQRQTSLEHIYDTNAYATPEQTPMRRHQPQVYNPSLAQSNESERPPRVSQLIQSFNTVSPPNI